MRFTVTPLPHRAEEHPRPDAAIDACVRRAADEAMNAVLRADQARRPYDLPLESARR